MKVDEHTIELDGEPVFLRRAPSDGPTPVYLHSVPTSAEDFTAALAVTGGIAVDLPGFGASAKGGQRDYSPAGYVDFLERLLDEAIDAHRIVLVGHGWGGAFALLLAGRRPETVAGIAMCNPLPLFDGFAWPRVARWWRTPGVGELLMGSVNRRLLARALRGGGSAPATWSDERIDRVWEQFDQGTQRAILRLHRSVAPGELAHAGRELDRLRMPALVLWGDRDPWLAPAFADRYGERLGDATVQHVDAGHWAWLDRPELVDTLAAFVARVR